MSAEFWIIGIVRIRNKRIPGVNLWTIALNKGNAKRELVRITNDLDPTYIAFKYSERVKAEITMTMMYLQKFQGRYKFCLLHYQDG